MLPKICRKVKELGIKIDYIEMEDNGHYHTFPLVVLTVIQD